MLFCPKHYFIFVISKQEQHIHILLEILGKFHVRSIFIGATDKKLWQLQFTVARVVIINKTACNKFKHGKGQHFINLCAKRRNFHVEHFVIRATVKKLSHKALTVASSCN